MPPDDRRLTDADVDALSKRVVECLLETVSDRQTVDRITAAWSGALDRAIGRGFRRVAGAVIIAVVMFGAVKFDILGKLFK